MSELGCQRHFFSPPEGWTYLNNAYMGLLPRATLAAGEKALKKRASVVEITPDDFFDNADRVRGLLAELIDAPRGQVAFVSSVASAMSFVAQNLATKSLRETARSTKPKKIVLLGGQFPSNVYPWRRLAKLGSFEIKTVAAPWSEGQKASSESLGQRAEEWNRNLLAAIDENTAVVSLESAHWTDGTLFDLKQIRQRTFEVGALFLIDATQTIGATPISFRDLEPDLLVSHCYKAMLASYGLGFAALSSRLLEFLPNDDTWLNRLGSRDFRNLTNYQDEYETGALRFDTPLRSNLILLDMLEASARQILSWGPKRIMNYIASLCREPLKELERHGIFATPETHRCQHLFGLWLPGGADPEVVQKKLFQAKIHVSARGHALRISPHVYNDQEDLLRFAEALKIALADR